VVDTLPTNLTGTGWTCAGTTCGAASGSGSINTTVNLASGASVVFTLNATVAAGATLSVSNTATVTAPAGISDPGGNNSATDTDNIVGVRPTPALLDNFNRGNAITLGGSWSQVVVPFLGSALRVNANQAFASIVGNAYWNVPALGFGAKQAAAFTEASTAVNGDTLILKASGAVAFGVATNYISVQYTGSQVLVGYTTNFGGTTIPTGVFTAALAIGDTLTALANTDGSVDVWTTTAAPASVTTYLGRSAPSAAFAGAGRIGIALATGARVDNFAGGTVA
jgi:hypothetical protein